MVDPPEGVRSTSKRTALGLLIPLTDEKLLTGSVPVRRGDYLMLVAFLPSKFTFTVSQLERFVPPAIAKLSS